MSWEHPHWLNWIPPEDDPDAAYPGRWIALLFISLAIMLIGVDVSITGVAAPSLSEELNASISDIQWVFDGFTLAVGGFVLLGGGLADRFGRKGIFQLGMTVFALGSLVAAFATSPAMVVGGRIITGLGAALVMPAALAMIGVIFGPDERPRAISIWAAIAAFGVALGPSIGGVLLQEFWFGSVFLINVPVCVIGIIGAAIFVPTSRKPGDHLRLDLVGAVLSVLGLTGIVGGIIEAPTRGISDPVVIGALVVGAVATGAFIWWELRVTNPLFDIRVFRIAGLVAGALSMVIIYLTWNGTQELLVPQYLQYVLGYSEIKTGLLLLPCGIVFGIASAFSAGAVRRFGHRAVFRLGLTLMAVGLLVYAGLAFWGGYANVLLATIVFFTGVGLVVAPATSIIMDSLPVEKAGDGSATNQIARQVGGAIGVAISGSIYATVYRLRLVHADFPLTTDQLTVAKTSVSGAQQVATQVPPNVATSLLDTANNATAAGMSWAFFFATCATLIVLLLTSRLMRGR